MRYVDDTTLIIWGKQKNLSNVVDVLQFLLNISGLELSKEKSMTYWSQKKSYKKLAWTKEFKWMWARNGELSQNV